MSSFSADSRQAVGFRAPSPSAVMTIRCLIVLLLTGLDIVPSQDGSEEG